MKLAVVIAAAIVAALLLSFFLGREQTPVDAVVSPPQSVDDGAMPQGEIGVVPSEGVDAQSGDAGTADAFEPMTARPDLLLQTETSEESETPPRTVAGLPAIERTVELPVVDPETVTVDANIGRTELPEARAPAPDSGFSPGPQGVVDYDGPLGGGSAQPDPNAPGPARVIGSGDIAPPAQLGDASGPGVPLDTSTAEGMDPMFTIPEEGEIEDPEDTPE